MKKSSRYVTNPLWGGSACALGARCRKVQFRDEARRQPMKELKAGRTPGASAMLRAKPMPRNDGREMALRGYRLNEWLDATKPVQAQRSKRGGTAVWCVTDWGGLGTTSTDRSGPVEASTITSRYLLNDAWGKGLSYLEDALLLVQS